MSSGQHDDQRVTDADKRFADNQAGRDRYAHLLTPGTTLHPVRDFASERSERIGQDNIERQVKAQAHGDTEATHNRRQQAAQDRTGHIFLCRYITAENTVDRTGKRLCLWRGQLLATEAVRLVQHENNADNDDRAKPGARELTDLLLAWRRTNQVARLQIQHQVRGL